MSRRSEHANDSTPLEAAFAGDAASSVAIRAACACGIALASGVLTYLLLAASGASIQANDFTYPWLAARALAHGAEPYAFVRAAPTPWGGNLFYPLPAAVLVLPLAWIPAALAGAIFVAVGTGVLALGLTRRSLWRLVVFCSAPAFHACRGVQWSPLLTGAALFAPALGVIVAKPNLALPLLAYQTRLRAVGMAAAGAVLLLIVSFAFSPSWPLRWAAALRSDPSAVQYRAPLLDPLGAAAALAILRWRRPEARLLFCMSCMPQNGFFYDQLPLMLVPETRMELLVVAMISQIAYYFAGAARLPGGNVPIWSAAYYPYMIAGLYLPAVVLVLRRQNVGEAPTWIEHLIEGAPRWLRGYSPIEVESNRARVR